MLQHGTLHEFMSRNREKLLLMIRDKMRGRLPGREDGELLAGVPGVFDEIVKALRREAGLPDATPEPGAAGAELGRARFHYSQRITLVAYGIGAISDSIGELGAAQGLQFAAREYQVFNQGIDASTAAAIDEYEKNSRAEQQREHSKRIGFISHEIRNALGSALLAYTTLKRGVMGINSRTGEILGRSLSTIQNQVNQALAAVQLEVAAPVVVRRIEIDPFLRYLQGTAIPDRGIEIQWVVQRDLAVEADERLLTSALGNLVQNALKFTRAGGRVIVRGRKESDRIAFEVEDECGGLPPKSEELLLAPFTQQGEDRRGLGLGLPITREATEKQGGTLKITNLPGKGCIFRLELPASANG